MSSDFRELASVDGTISSTGDAMVPLKDDGLYRGDGAFEVIRLYEGRPFALADHLDRLGPLGRRDRARVRPRRAGGRDRGPAGRVRRRRRAAAADRHPRRPADRRHRADPAPRREREGGDRHLLRPASSSTASSPSPTPPTWRRRGSPKPGRRRGGAGPARRHRAGAADLLDLLGLPAGRPPHDRARAPVLESITRDRLVKALKVEEGEWPVDDLRAAGEAFLASTTREIQAVSAIDGADLPEAPGPRTREAQAAFAETLGRELRT